MEIFRIAVIGVICAVLCVLVKQYRPDIAPIVQIGGIIVIAVMSIDLLKEVIEQTNDLFGMAEIISDGYLELLIKVLGVAIVTKIASDLCNDSGNSALATNVELAGKVVILIMCLSLIKTIASLAGGLLK